MVRASYKSLLGSGVPAVVQLYASWCLNSCDFARGALNIELYLGLIAAYAILMIYVCA